MQLETSDHEGLTPLDLVIQDRLSYVNFHHAGNRIKHCQACVCYRSADVSEIVQDRHSYD